MSDKPEGTRKQWCGNPGCEQDLDIHAHDCKGEKIVMPKNEVPRKDDMETCKSGCTYSRSMDQVYPRKCIWCGKTEVPKEKAENEVPSEEQSAREFIVPLLQEAFRKYLALFGVECHGTDKQVSALAELGIIPALSALRASWKKEKKELEERVRELEIGKKSDKDEIVKMAEAICMQANENTRLKAENERLRKWEDSHCELTERYDENYEAFKRIKIERDTLTCALAEARETLEIYAKDDFIRFLLDTGKYPDSEHPCHKAREALKNTTGLRASEEMKALRKVVESGKKLDERIELWRKGVAESVEVLAVANELREALEAYESRGKV